MPSVRSQTLRDETRCALLHTAKGNGGQEKRLVITDPVVALGPTKTAAEKMVTLLMDFQQAHADGMTALQRGDFDAFGDAIKRERDIIETQSEMIEQSTGKKSTRRK
jgi:hypothetical protein